MANMQRLLQQLPNYRVVQMRFTSSLVVNGDIKLEFDDSHGTYNEKTYQRVLDLETTTVKFTYFIGEVDFTREYFDSNPNQVVIVMKISGNKPGCVSLTLSLQSQLDHHLHVNERRLFIMEGNCPGKRIPCKVNADDSPKGIQFSAILDVQISDDSGALHFSDEGKLQIDGCNGAVVLLLASSSFDG